jgi:hypothetical protein
MKQSALKSFMTLLVPYALLNWANYLSVFNNEDLKNLTNNLLSIYEFIFIGWVYTRLIKGGKILKRINILYWILIIVSILDVLFLQGFYQLNSYTIIIGSCISVYFIIEYFREIIQQTQNIHLLKDPFFWISIGYLFHFIGLFILVSFGEYFKYIHDYDSFLPIWHLFNNLIITILYSCLLIAFSFKLKPTIT